MPAVRDGVTVVVPAFNEELLINRTLDSLKKQITDVPYRVVVVDNNSTDATPEIVCRYAGVTLLQEPRKGTGYAANTGFEYAIEENRSQTVMRTDADTVPSPYWIDVAIEYLKQRQKKQLITGPIKPLRDAYYRDSDELLLPLAYTAYRVGVTGLKRTLWPLRVARGGNMAVRAAAFKEVGGFPDGAIDEIDDDLELTKSIYAAYGLHGLGNVRDMQVRTSMRRIRKTGWLGLGKYYLTPRSEYLSNIREQIVCGDIDIR